MNTSIWKLIKVAFATILRPLVVDKIKESTTQVDDFILGVLDKLFDYDGNAK
jgi:hypothetical protein